MILKMVEKKQKVTEEEKELIRLLADISVIEWQLETKKKLKELE